MSADQLIAEYKALEPEQRQKVAEAMLRDDVSWIPESFRLGMEEIVQGKVVPLEIALEKTPPSA